jgi:hypothetical protein
MNIMSWAPLRRRSLLLIALGFLFGCGSSNAVPNSPKIRVEGPAGAQFGIGVTYVDGPQDVDASGTAKKIGDGGVYTEDLKGGHAGLMVEVTPSGTDTLTLILLDGGKEVRRATAKGSQDSARILVGNPPPLPKG